MTWRYFLLFLIILNQLSRSQVNEIEFLQTVNSLYYSLESSDLQNFSAWISSDYFRENLKDVMPNEEYPLEIIWTNPNRIFFIKRPLPVISDSVKSDMAQTLQLEMQQELKGLLIDWQRFYGGNLLAGLPAQYKLTTRSDTVLLEYETLEQGEKIQACLYFGQNGLWLKLLLKYIESPQEINIYPVFNYIENKWLCSGWQVQMLEKSEVQSGFIVQIISHKIDKYWLPKRLNMQLQTKDKKDLIYHREYNFYNVMTNRSIKVVE